MNENKLAVEHNHSSKGAQIAASDWISKIDRGLNQEEESSLHRWLAESDQNRHVLTNMATLWDNLSSLKRFR